MLSASLGDEFERGGVRWRVVRIVRQDALFESDGVLEIISEHLLELKAETGSIDFEVLSSSREPYLGQTGSIKAPERIEWRRD